MQFDVSDISPTHLDLTPCTSTTYVSVVSASAGSASAGHYIRPFISTSSTSSWSLVLGTTLSRCLHNRRTQHLTASNRCTQYSKIVTSDRAPLKGPGGAPAEEAPVWRASRRSNMVEFDDLEVKGGKIVGIQIDLTERGRQNGLLFTSMVATAM